MVLSAPSENGAVAFDVAHLRLFHVDCRKERNVSGRGHPRRARDPISEDPPSHEVSIGELQAVRSIQKNAIPSKRIKCESWG